MTRTSACSVCSGNCKTDSILCEQCNTWSHAECESIDSDEYKLWTRKKFDYICNKCRTDDEGCLDYNLGLARLKQASMHGLKKLKNCAAREKIFLRKEAVKFRIHTDFSEHNEDSVANFTLREYHIRRETALISTGNGDCLFNSVSTYLVSDESKSIELRYRCCLEMTLNKNKILQHRLNAKFEDIAPDYDKECINCARPGSYSCVWHLMALSYALNMPVESVYPAVNGSRDIVFKILNIVFKPPFSDPENGTIVIMWSNTCAPPKNNFVRASRHLWFPNHFVPLVSRAKSPLVTSECQPGTSHDPLATSRVQPGISHDPKIRTETQPGTSHDPIATSKIQPGNSQYPVATSKIQLGNSQDPVATSKIQLGNSQDPVATSKIQLGNSQDPVATSKIQLGNSQDPVATSKIQLGNSQDPVATSKIQPGTRHGPNCRTEIQTGSSHDPVAISKIQPGTNHDPNFRTEIQPGTSHDPVATSRIQPGAVLDPNVSTHVQHGTRQLAMEPITNMPKIVLDISPTTESFNNLFTIVEEYNDYNELYDGYDNADVCNTQFTEDASSKTAMDEECTYTDVNEPEDDETDTGTKTTGLVNTFMEFKDVINTFRETQTTLKEIPPGRKDGKHFIIDNRRNVERRMNGKASAFWDDCGAWRNGSSPVTYHLVENGNRTLIVKQRGLFVKCKRIGGKREFTPITPQPDRRDILTVHRLYQTLKLSPSGSNQFKRRITWLEKAEHILPGISDGDALVEYIGVFPGRGCHGTVKDEESNVSYIRTKRAVMEQLQKKLKTNGPKKVEIDMNKTIKEDLNKQRNEKQLHNIKYSIRKREKIPSEMGNLADQIISLEELTKTSKFIQSVKHVNGLQHPVITLFTQQQITDIKRFCCKLDGIVLGMDKTYNLGDFFVTPTVYKDKSVIKRTTKDHPICFGPTFVHTKSSTKIYSSFLHDVADNFTDAELQQLTVGTDEELAFKNAIKRCLPGATHVLCTRHLKQNANKHMEDAVGYPLKERQEIIQLIFGEQGLVENTDEDIHNVRLQNVRDAIIMKDSRVGEKKFIKYFNGKLYPLLITHIIVPVRRGKITPNWTNNNSESANHVLKSHTNWKITQLPKFVSMLEDIVSAELEERTRAIRNMGNFGIADNFRHHSTDIDTWTSLNQQQRDKKMKRFLTDTGRDHPNLIRSSDGTRTVMRSPTAGRKLNQVKRKRAERTPSKNVKRKL